MPPTVLLRDVTLREHGQNVRASDMDRFMPDARLWLARELTMCGIKAMEVASCASPKVAPAMADDHLLPFLHALGPMEGTELITLVPSAASSERFFDLGLGPDGLGHTLGVFVSAVEAHNQANVHRSIDQSMAELTAFLPTAQLLGVPVSGYVSGGWGWIPDGGSEPLDAPREVVLALASQLAAAGARSITVSDLQGVASPEATGDLVAALVAHLRDRPAVAVGYHPHHTAVEPVLDNVQAAVEAGATIVDGSLGATGGCITGAPGNAPTEAVAARLEAMGVETGVDVTRLEALAREGETRLFG